MTSKDWLYFIITILNLIIEISLNRIPYGSICGNDLDTIRQAIARTSDKAPEFWKIFSSYLYSKNIETYCFMLEI